MPRRNLPSRRPWRCKRFRPSALPRRPGCLTKRPLALRSPAVQHVQQIGTAAYLNEQFATPTTLMPAIPNPPVATCPNGTFSCAQSSFWKNALTANDQLRQRVAFALSEIFVVSTDMVNARTIPSYQNLLADDAFGNFRQLLNDVATSPAMGAYLNMLNSGAAPAGQIANENFARELMQLFTTGLYLLNPDGSSSAECTGAAAAGLHRSAGPGLRTRSHRMDLRQPHGWRTHEFPNGVPNFDQPMQAIEVAHDMSAKALLSGVTLPAGQTAEQDLCRGDRFHLQSSQRGPFRRPSAYPAPGHQQSFTRLRRSRRRCICQRRVRCPRRYEGSDHRYSE